MTSSWKSLGPSCQKSLPMSQIRRSPRGTLKTHVFPLRFTNPNYLRITYRSAVLWVIDQLRMFSKWGNFSGSMIDNYIATESGYPGGKSQSHWAVRHPGFANIVSIYGSWGPAAWLWPLAKWKQQVRTGLSWSLQFNPRIDDVSMLRKKTETTHQHAKPQ